MINFDDIKQRNHQEPAEVAQIRKKITESFSRLVFLPQPHKYFIKHDDGTTTELPCVSDVTHKFEPETDWDSIAERKAIKEHTTKDALLRQWKENKLRASNNGTSTHLFGESYMHFFMGHPEQIDPIVQPQYEEGFLIPYSKKQEAIVAFYTELMTIDNIYPVMPEAQVYMGVNPEYHDIIPYAGTFDMLFAYQSSDGVWKLLLYDWKTNTALYNTYNKEHQRTAKPPFHCYTDEALTYYILQLNCYALCLNQLGFEVADRKVIWLKDDGTYEKISIPNICLFLKSLVTFSDVKLKNLSGKSQSI